jgi:predicted phosphodiesterase
MKVSADRFIEAWKATNGSPSKVAKILGYSSLVAVSNRRLGIEKKLGITLTCSAARSERHTETKRQNSRRIQLDMRDGCILIGSDAHVWPGDLTTAQRGFIHLAKQVKPDALILNGDVFDGARISRHPAGMWDQEKRPGVREEIEACQAFTGELEGCSAKRYWTWGNHDARMEYTLAATVPQYEGVPGFALKDHFPAWTFCMAIFINDNLVVKHRLANGMHAAHNNAVKSGRTIVTGHLHSLKVTPWTDYNGTRYGVDCGTLAEPGSKQFDYGEEGPSNHRAGFALLTIKNGRVLMPELIQVHDDDHVEFRGKLVKV